MHKVFDYKEPEFIQETELDVDVEMDNDQDKENFVVLLMRTLKYNKALRVKINSLVFFKKNCQL